MRAILDIEDNPVRRARHAMGLSLHGIEDLSSIHYQTWYLTERGCYASVPPGIARFLEREAGFNPLVLEENYFKFVRACREQFSEFYSGLFDVLEVDECTSVKEVYLHLGLTRSAFAKLLCVQPAVLYKLESGRQQKMPEQLWEALVEVGFNPEFVKRLGV